MKFFISLIIVFSLLSGVSISADNENGVNLYVSQNAAPGGSGSVAKPFATLAQARDCLRAMGGAQNGATVNIMGGEYFFDSSFELNGKDSGSADFPVIYRAYNGEPVILSGAKPVDSKTAAQVSQKNALDRIKPEAREKIRVIDLSGMPNSGAADKTELYYNGEVMPLARYPNDGYAVMSAAASAPTGSSAFVFNNDRTADWETAPDAMVGFYEAAGWRWYSYGVKSVSGADSVVTLNNTGAAKDLRFMIYNLLEELDRPGEYYIDRQNRLLYWYPPANTDGGLRLGFLETPVIKIDNAENIVFEGLTVGYCGNNGIDILNSNNVTVRNCAVKNLAEDGIYTNGSVNVKIDGCEIYNTGYCGVNINGGGDPAELIPGGNSVTNCDIYNFSRLMKTYKPGINLSNSVAPRAAHNRIHNAPHMAIGLYSYETVAEYNEIYNVCRETKDSSAIYAGRELDKRGNVARRNYIHDIPLYKGAGGSHVYGIYYDDFQAGLLVEENVFYNVDYALIMGGGSDNTLRNNIAVDCVGNLIFDNRAENWAKSNFMGNVNNTLRRVPWENGIWLKKYPEIGLVYSSDIWGGIPQRNIVEKNIFINGSDLSVNASVISYGTVENNLYFKEEQKQFGINAERLENAFGLVEGFNKIDLSEIGLLYEPGRQSVPLLYPENNEKNIEALNAEFLWQGGRNDRYRITVAVDEAFSGIVIDEKVDGTAYTTDKLKYGERRYWWKVMPESGAESPVFSFVTARDEPVDKRELSGLLDSVGDKYLSVDEGDAPGNYGYGSVEELKSVIYEAKKTENASDVKQKTVKRQVKAVRQALDSFNSKLIYKISDINGMLSDPKGWATPEYLIFENGEITYPWNKDCPFIGYKGRQIGTDEILKFKTVMSLNNYQGFGLNQPDYGVQVWMTSGYAILVKRDVFELQRRYYDDAGKLNGGIIATFANEDVILSDDWQDIEIGCVNTFNGVRVIFNVNGKSVIDYTDDSEFAVRDSGYFVMYDGSGDALAKMKLAAAE